MIYKKTLMLIWMLYDEKKGYKLGFINKNDKSPHDYLRDFFIYKQKTDIYGNPVVMEPLHESKMKRFIYYVPAIQK